MFKSSKGSLKERKVGNSIWKRFRRQKEVKLLFIGLDGAGKTTLLYRLKLGRDIEPKPTVGYNAETVQHRNVRMTCWDVGVRDRTRTLVKHYLPGTDGLVCVIDSTDRERFSEVFPSVIEPVTQEPSMNSVPVLVLANKQDLPEAVDPKELRDAIEQSGSLETSTWQLFSVSAATGLGLNKSLDWITAAISKGGKHMNVRASVSEPNLVTLNARGDIHVDTDTGGSSTKRSSKLAGFMSTLRRSILRK